MEVKRPDNGKRSRKNRRYTLNRKPSSDRNQVLIGIPCSMSFGAGILDWALNWVLLYLLGHNKPPLRARMSFAAPREARRFCFFLADNAMSPTRPAIYQSTPPTSFRFKP